MLVELLQGAFSGLRQGDTIVGVLGSHVQAIDLAGQTVGDLLASSVQSLALLMREPVDGRCCAAKCSADAGRVVQVSLVFQRSDVGVDGQGHLDARSRTMSMLPELAALRLTSPRHPKVRAGDLYRRFSEDWVLTILVFMRIVPSEGFAQGYSAADSAGGKPPGRSVRHPGAIPGA